jgi:PPOX class probable F420-dependent enzyme
LRSPDKGGGALAVDSIVVDLTIARQRVADARVGRLATITPEIHPHIVPCCFFLDSETVYSAVDAKPKSTLALRRLENLTANPSCSLLVDHYSEDWTTLWWVRLDGIGRVIFDGPERQLALDLLASKYEQYRVSPPPGPVVAMEVVSWRTWP